MPTSPEDTAYSTTLAYIDSHIGRGVKPGLERVSGALGLLADPQLGYPVIHVAGTNGKTSTARMIAAILGAHGLHAGLFTSPHLHAVEERFEAGGEAMTPAQLVAAVTEIGPIVDLYGERSGDPLTYFELTTVMAFSWFAERAVDVAVIETGLGGRLDSTDIAAAEVAVVTSVGLDHTKSLGSTLGEIAFEKVAILDERATLVTGALPDEALEPAEARVREMEASWHRMGEGFRPDEVQRAVGGWRFDVEGVYERYEELDLRSRGRHQVDNFAVAVAAVEGLTGRALDSEAVREAALGVALPGRMEVVPAPAHLVLDSAHNPPGAEALARALREEFPTTTWNLVFGAMGDKDVAGILEPLRGMVASVHATAADSPRALPAGEAAELAAQVLAVPATAHASVADALGAVPGGEPLLVTGSIYIVGAARKALGIA